MKVYARLLQYLGPYRLVFFASLAALTLGSLLDGFTMVLLIPFLRSLFGGPAILAETGNAVERFLDFTVGRFLTGDPSESLRNVVIVVMLGLILKNLSYYTATILGVRVREGIVRDMRDQLYGHLQKLPLGFFDRNKTGQLIARVFSDTNQTKEIITHVVADLLKHVVSLVAFVLILLLISWRLTLLALVLAPLLLGFLKPMLWRLRSGFRRVYDAQGELTSILQETASGARLVKAYGAEDYERGRFAETNQQLYKGLVRAERIHHLGSPLSEILGGIVTLILVWVGAHLVFSAELTAEAFLTFLMVSLRVQSPIKALTTFPARAHVSLAAADRLFEIFDTPIEPVSVGARRIDEFHDRIVYEDVHFEYDSKEPVLKGVSFQVNRGEVVALVGPSGGGKSTIVDLLPRFYEAVSGRITLDVVDISEIGLDSLRHLMGVVSQETIIFHDTVRANIAYGSLTRFSQEEIEAAARAANAHEFIMATPEGYDTVLGDRGVRLSGGQRQRIAIARAILRDPPILIFDEATSSLDSESERLVQGAIDRLLADRTVIVIAHRLSTIRYAHQILVLDDGRIVESGTHDELVGRQGPYRRLYNLEFRKADEADAAAAPDSRNGVTVR